MRANFFLAAIFLGLSAPALAAPHGGDSQYQAAQGSHVTPGQAAGLAVGAGAVAGVAAGVAAGAGTAAWQAATAPGAAVDPAPMVFTAGKDSAADVDTYFKARGSEAYQVFDSWSDMKAEEKLTMIDKQTWMLTKEGAEALNHALKSGILLAKA